MEFELSLKNLAMLGGGRILEKRPEPHPSGQRQVKSRYPRSLWVHQKVPDPLPSPGPSPTGTDGLTLF